MTASSLAAAPATFLTTPIPLLDRSAKVLLIAAIFFMPLGTSPAYAFMALSALAWFAAGGYRTRLLALRGNGMALAAVALYVLLLIGALYSTGEHGDISNELRKYAKLLFMLPAFTLLAEPAWRERALNAFALAMLITLVVSMLSVVWPLPYIRAVPGNHYVFKDHIIQNLMMAFFVLIMLVRTTTAATLAARLLYAGLAILATVNVLAFVGGRTGHLALIGVIAVFAIFCVPARLRWLFLAGAMLAGVAIFQFSDTFRSRFELAVTEFEQRDVNQLSSVGQRIEYARKSMQLISERPVFGWGTGAYPREFCRVAATEELCRLGRVHPHNQFLGIGVQLGLVGILVYLVFLGAGL
ncbi:MAG TPA: O-antigen ligase family protein, partial [Noviherbaspirillum sp.]